jgi:MFS family permease
MLALGSILMAGSGVVFGLASNFWILLTAAIVGIISPSGSEIGPFRAIEESTLAHLTPPKVRPDIFSWYSLIGSAGAAFSMIVCGWVVRALEARHGWELLQAYRAIFFGYGAVGLLKFVLSLCLSSRCEAEREPEPAPTAEEAPLLGEQTANGAPKPKKSRRRIFPHISKKSRGIFLKLAILFGLDSFGSSLASLSWITNFFKRKFHLQEGYLGSLFFTTSIIAAMSVLVAASLARRFGNVKTMVFTHLPSSIALALLGIPNSLPLSMALLIFRACTQSMDVAPRSAFLAAIMLPNERTAVMGAINVVKTGAQSMGPIITGVLASKNLFWVAFLLAGSLKTIYDVTILTLFLNHESREEREAREEDEGAGSGESRAA